MAVEGSDKARAAEFASAGAKRAVLERDLQLAADVVAYADAVSESIEQDFKDGQRVLRQLAAPNHICEHQDKPVSTESEEDARLVKDSPHPRGDGVGHIAPSRRAGTLFVIGSSAGRRPWTISFAHLSTGSLVTM